MKKGKAFKMARRVARRVARKARERIVECPDRIERMGPVFVLEGVANGAEDEAVNRNALQTMRALSLMLGEMRHVEEMARRVWSASVALRWVTWSERAREEVVAAHTAVFGAYDGTEESDGHQDHTAGG